LMHLGLMLGMSYEQKELVLEADDIALFYSDGLVEAHNPYGKIFGFPRLRTLVAEYGEEASWVTYSRRNFTHSPERAGSRRTT
jgi:serine phosphatase RsbU (regulator of sigma subunit)